MLTQVGKWAERLAAVSPWTNVYGLARTLLAVGTLVTLAATPSEVLFQPAGGAAHPPVCNGPRQISVFCLAPHGPSDVVRWLAVLALLVVASGYRPRLTGIVHWWIAFSFQSSSPIGDGGDQAAAVLSLLLLPLTLLDGRAWHWQTDESRGGFSARIFGHITLRACRLQVAGIYLHAAAGKFQHEEWANGTAIYYWFRHPLIGARGWVLALVGPLVVTRGVALITWGTIVFEFFLAAAIIAPRKPRQALLGAGIAFHGGILLIHGLVSFATIMFGALVLLMRMPDEKFALPRWGDVKGTVRGFLAAGGSQGPALSPVRSKM